MQSPRRYALWSLVVALSACSDGSGPSSTVTGGDIYLDPQPMEVLLPGQSYQLRIAAHDSAFNSVSGVVGHSWKSSNPSVATVDLSGVLLLHAQGVAELSARIDTATAHLSITVSAPVATVTMQADTIAVTAVSLVPGGSLALRAVLADAQSQVLAERTVEWTVNDASLATISDKQGARAQVTVLSIGSVKVYATREGVTDSLLVSIEPVSYTKVATGSAFTCGLTAQNVAWCWGGGGGDIYGQLGRILAYPERTPAPVATDLRFRLLAAGAGHVCALLTSGEAYCWGSNSSGQLGDGSTTDRPHPTPVVGGLVFDTLVAGDQITCGLTSGGAGYCWGGAGGGEIGTGGQNSLVPAPIAGGHSFTVLATTQKSFDHAQEHTCGIDASGAAWCWGTNVFGQLGDSTQVDKSTPARVRGGHTFVEIGTGADFTCGRITDGSVLCWGANYRYQIAAPVDSSLVVVPFRVQGLSGVTHLQSGSLHTCVLDASGQGQCWGDNISSQLGSGVDNAYPRAILPIAGSQRFTMIEAGDAHSCGVTSLGQTLCWGTMGGNTPTAVIGQP